MIQPWPFPFCLIDHCSSNQLYHHLQILKQFFWQNLSPGYPLLFKTSLPSKVHAGAPCSNISKPLRYNAPTSHKSDHWYRLQLRQVLGALRTSNSKWQTPTKKETRMSTQGTATKKLSFIPQNRNTTIFIKCRFTNKIYFTVKGKLKNRYIGLDPGCMHNWLIVEIEYNYLQVIKSAWIYNSKVSTT